MGWQHPPCSLSLTRFGVQGVTLGIVHVHKLLVPLDELLAGPRAGQTELLEPLPQLPIRQQVINNFGHQLPFVVRAAKENNRDLI